MFEFNPELMLGDDDEADEGVIERETEEVRSLYFVTTAIQYSFFFSPFYLILWP